MAIKKTTENNNCINFAQLTFYDNSPVDVDSEDAKLAAIIEKASQKDRDSGAYVLKQIKYLMDKGGVFDAHLSVNNPPENSGKTQMYTLLDTANNCGDNSPKEDEDNG